MALIVEGEAQVAPRRNSAIRTISVDGSVLGALLIVEVDGAADH